MCPKCGNPDSVYLDPEGFIACNLCGMRSSESEVIERVYLRPRAEAFAKSIASQIPGCQIHVPDVQWCSDPGHGHARFMVVLPRPVQFLDINVVLSNGFPGGEEKKKIDE